MKTLTAFVAKSFRDEDLHKTEPIERFLTRFRKLGLIWQTAEPAEVESVSKKVRNLIEAADVFVGILTRRDPLFRHGHGLRQGLRLAFGKLQPSAWSAPPWVLQESGYALRAGKRLILFRELEVDIGGLQGDLEYIPYDPQHPDEAFAKAHEMISGLIAQEGQIEVKVITEAAAPPTRLSPEATNRTVDVAPVPQGDERSGERIADLWTALEARDLEAAAAAYTEGLARLDPADTGRVMKWKLVYLSLTHRIGREQSLDDLAELQRQAPTDPSPSAVIGLCYERFQQYDKAAQYYRHAADIASGGSSATYHVKSAACLRAAKKLDVAKSQLERLLTTPDLPLKSRVAALKELYSVLKELEEEDFAFAIGELVLVDNPGDAGFRFVLGYDCLDRYPRVSAYHYEMLCKQQPEDSVALNNLGFAYEKVELSIHSAKKYRQAADLKEARAFRNLGLNLVNAGFADEALALLGGVGDISDPDGLVPQAVATVHERIASEQTKQGEVLESTRPHRGFMPKMGAALLEGLQAPIDGDWLFPIATLKLKSRGKEISGEGVVEYKSLAVRLLASVGEHVDSASQPNGKTIYTFSGEFTGRVCRFTITKKTVYENSFIPSETGETFRGYALFESRATAGEVGEYKDQRLSTFYTIKRVFNSQ
jgi:tetratricopeptide (TPR) repeat protein